MIARALVIASFALLHLTPVYGGEGEQASTNPAKPLTLKEVWGLDATYTDQQHGVTFRYPSVWKAAAQFGYHPPALTESDVARPIASFGYEEGGFPRDHIVGPYSTNNLEGFGIVYSAIPAANASACETTAATAADVTIPLGAVADEFEDSLQEQFRAGIDVVLDYLWGASAEHVIIAAAKGGREAVPIRFVQIGSVSAPNITLPSAALRSSAIELMGSGLNSIPMDRLLKSIEDLLRATEPAGLTISTNTFPLSEVESVWSSAPNNPRVVFTLPVNSSVSALP